MQKIYSERKWYERLAFSPLLAKKNLSHKIAYLGVNTALLIVCNAFLEVKFIDVQFSVTLFVSIITGILLGAGSGFLACFIGDALGFMISSWGYMYMPWVGLTTATTALYRA
ncbi:MAG: ECF transporter S component [Clostridia bacterium]|nr:ECF transporter S component [Clostridia bacterium]